MQCANWFLYLLFSSNVYTAVFSRVYVVQYIRAQGWCISTTVFFRIIAVSMLAVIAHRSNLFFHDNNYNYCVWSRSRHWGICGMSCACCMARCMDPRRSVPPGACEVCLWLPLLQDISNTLVSFCCSRLPRVSFRALLLRRYLWEEVLINVSGFLVAADVQIPLPVGVVCAELMRIMLRLLPDDIGLWDDVELEGDDTVIES